MFNDNAHRSGMDASKLGRLCDLTSEEAGRSGSQVICRPFMFTESANILSIDALNCPSRPRVAYQAAVGPPLRPRRVVIHSMTPGDGTAPSPCLSRHRSTMATQDGPVGADPIHSPRRSSTERIDAFLVIGARSVGQRIRTPCGRSPKGRRVSELGGSSHHHAVRVSIVSGHMRLITHNLISSSSAMMTALDLVQTCMQAPYKQRLYSVRACVCVCVCVQRRLLVCTAVTTSQLASRFLETLVSLVARWHHLIYAYLAMAYTWKI
jgi:hypothetical protein